MYTTFTLFVHPYAFRCPYVYPYVRSVRFCPCRVSSSALLVGKSCFSKTFFFSSGDNVKICMKLAKIRKNISNVVC